MPSRSRSTTATARWPSRRRRCRGTAVRLPGRRHQVFDFAQSGLAERPKALRAVVTASDRPVRYLVVDLLKTAGEDGQREYIYAGDGRLVTHKDFPVTYRVSDDPADGGDKRQRGFGGPEG